MIVCGQCGEKGIDAVMRCKKCGARTIHRRTSFNTPLKGDRDRWANRYLLPDSSAHSPHLRRQTIPAPNFRRTASRRLSDDSVVRPIQPLSSPFEVVFDDINSPITRHLPLPILPSALRLKSHNVTRPTLTHAYSAPMPKLPPLQRALCDHHCGCGKPSNVPVTKKADPHAPVKMRLFGDLKRVCQRTTPDVHTLANQSAHNPRKTLAPPRPLPVNLPTTKTHIAFDSRQPNIPTFTNITAPIGIRSSKGTQIPRPQASTQRAPTTSPRMHPDPDYLPLTSVPQNISTSPTSYAPVLATPSGFRAPRSFPAARIDIVPNSTPMSVYDRKATFLREMSRGVGSVTAPGSRIVMTRGPSVADTAAKYEASEAGANVVKNLEPRQTAKKPASRKWPPVSAVSTIPTVLSSRISDVRSSSISKPAGPREFPYLSHVCTSTTHSARHNPTPIRSRTASLSSVETVIIRNLSPLQPLPEHSDVARIRAMFERVLPPQGSRPGRTLAPAPRHATLSSQSCATPHISSTSATVSLPSAQRYPAGLTKTKTIFLGGNMPSCPCCGDKIAYFDQDRIVGPYGTIWHKSCLKCGAGEGAGKRKVRKEGCGKALDSRAGVDLEGVVWCKRCSLERRPSVTPSISVSPALPPPQQSQRRIISLKHPRPMRLNSPDILFRVCTARWPTPICVTGSRHELWRRTSSSRRRRMSGRMREGVV